MGILKQTPFIFNYSVLDGLNLPRHTIRSNTRK